MSLSNCCYLVVGLVLAEAFGSPIPFSDSRLPLAAVSDLSSRLVAHSQRVQALQDSAVGRLPLPTPSDIEAIKKVAQILITLGQQVIPAIIGEPTPVPNNCESALDDADEPEDSI